MPTLFIVFFTLMSTFFISSTTLAGDLPSDSIYQFDATWQSADGRTLKLEQLAGKQQIAAMFYSHCLTACPVIVADMKKIEAKLSEQQKQQTGFILISLDTENDSPKTLAAFAKKRELGKNWTLLYGNKEQVRALSMLLDVRYQNTEDGEIAHSKLLHLLDQKGRLIKQTKQISDTKKLIQDWQL